MAQRSPADPRIPESRKKGVWSCRIEPPEPILDSPFLPAWISPVFPNPRAGISLPALPGPFIHKTPLRKKKYFKNPVQPKPSCGRIIWELRRDPAFPARFSMPGGEARLGKGYRPCQGCTNHAGKHTEAPGSGLTHSTFKITLGEVFFPPFFPFSPLYFPFSLRIFGS